VVAVKVKACSRSSILDIVHKRRRLSVDMPNRQSNARSPA
jgi:hypothetical protein